MARRVAEAALAPQSWTLDALSAGWNALRNVVFGRGTLPPAWVPPDVRESVWADYESFRSYRSAPIPDRYSNEKWRDKLLAHHATLRALPAVPAGALDSLVVPRTPGVVIDAAVSDVAASITRPLLFFGLGLLVAHVLREYRRK